jgi:hypothetical protein
MFQKHDINTHDFQEIENIIIIILYYNILL